MPSLPEQKFTWIRNFFKSNPLITAWNAILLFGGCILLFFHAGLSYLPDFSSNDLVGLLASVTLIGLLLIATLIIGCFFPGLILRWIENDFSKNREKLFNSTKEKLLLLFFGTVLWAFFFIVPEDWYIDILVEPREPSFFLALTILSVFFAGYIAIDKPVCWMIPLWRNTWVWFRACGLFLWGMMLLFPFSIATIFASVGEVNFEATAALSISYLLLIFNGVVYVMPKKDIRYAVLIGVLLIGVLIPLIVGHFLFLPKFIMETLALGNRKAATIVVNGKQCYTFAQLGVNCSAGDAEKGAIELQNVNVLSRIGTSVLVELLVEQKSDVDISKQQLQSVSGLLYVNKKERQMYCPDSNSKDGECSRCDKMLLERLTTKINTNELSRINAYKQNLVCVQLSVPKTEIYNFSLTNGRSYKGFTSFTLPSKSFQDASQEK